MKNSIRHIPLFLILVAALAMTAGAKKNDSNAEELQRKSHYVFLEAMRKKAIGEFDSYYELLRYAYNLDTANTAIGYYLGYMSLVSEDNTAEKLETNLSLMRKHFDSVPEDQYESAMYGNVCNKLRRNDEALRVWSRLVGLFPSNVNFKYKLADTYAAKGNFKQAIAIYDSIEVNEGMSIPITLRKVNYHMAYNDTAGSIDEGLRLVKSAPANVDYNLFMGNMYLQFSEHDSAMLYFDKALEIDPNNGYAYLYKADYYKLAGDSVNYDKQIYNALINKNIEIDQKISVLTDYVRESLRDTIMASERAENLFSVLIDQHPHESAIHDLYSQYLVTVKDYGGAAEQLGYVLDLEPANAENWKKLMLINLMDENYEEAFKAADKALEYNPDNIELYQYIAPAYYQIEEYDKAIATYAVAMEKADTTDSELMSSLASGLGDVYFMKKDTLKAFEQYEKALEYNPGNIMAMNNYAYFLAESGQDLDKAERLSGMSVKYEPENPTYLDTYAWIYFKKGEYSLALTYMKAAIANSDGEQSAELYEHYGDILFMNGFHEEALPNWEKALELNPDSEILQRKVKHKTFFFK
ncbi:MAG: tetratricopeptide repeat protein [Muribaculaceae bacterium]|nr:tetratricopeptide repeat protein [Muribaculaceae bacterium]